MGGGVSRLEETIWEEVKDSAEEISKCVTNDKDDVTQKQSRTLTKSVADGGLDPQSLHQTLDNVLPTSCYKKIELQKTHYGQREYDIVDASTNEVLYKTAAVPGTLAWFDILKPTVCGEPISSDYILRIRPVDHLRKTWIVYKFHTPTFEGQKPINFEDSNTTLGGGAHRGLDKDTKLYKTACITVSWSRYVLVAARYTRPEPEDWQIKELQVCEQDGKEARCEIEASAIDNETEQSASRHDHDKNDEFITPREMVELQVKLQESSCSDIGGIEESKTDETSEFEPCHQSAERVANENSGSKIDSENCEIKHHFHLTSDAAAMNRPTSGGAKVSRSSSSIAQTKLLRTHFGDTTSSIPESIDEHNVSSNKLGAAASKLKFRSSSLLKLGKKHLSASFSSFRKPIHHKYEGNEQDERENKKEHFLQSSQREEMSEEDSVDVTPVTCPNETVLSEMVLNLNETTADAIPFNTIETDEGKHQRLLQLQMQNYERAMEGVLDLDGGQPIVQCQEIASKMMGNHQTFNTTKKDLLALLKLETKSRQEQNKSSNDSIDSEHSFPYSNGCGDSGVQREVDRYCQSVEQKSQVSSVQSSWRWLASTAIPKVKRNKSDGDIRDRAISMGLTESCKNGDSDGNSSGANETGECNTCIPLSPLLGDSSPGNGVEEAKEEVIDREDDRLGKSNISSNTPVVPAQTNNINGKICGLDASASSNSVAQHSEVNPMPLVSYFFWKHTSLNLGKHKMHMHLSRHSDLALHVVFAIVSNQVRSERNHAVFLATGIHPSWLYIDPRNPRATIS